jgi:SAM-dependent methyltransferase
VRSGPSPSAAGQTPRRYPFARYLSAKATVDDRSLNAHVWDTLRHALDVRRQDAGLKLVELGSGIGTMVERLLARRLFSGFTYRGIEAQPRLANHAARRLSAWGRKHGYSVVGLPEELVLRREAEVFRLSFPAADALQVARRKRQTADLLMAHAFLDLLDLPTALPALLGMLRPGGLFYFTLNFDGVTAFEPLIDPALDDQILGLYHRTMDERLVGGRRSGDSRTGRHLLAALQATDVQVLAAGASDWVVVPVKGRYPEDEAYFLHFILHTVDRALRRHPELDPRRFARWVERRHAQIERGELVYIAHQLDVVGRVPIRRHTNSAG